MTAAPPPPEDEREKPSLTRQVLAGGLWFSFGTVIRALLRLTVVAILARILAPAEFGLVGAAGIFVAFAELFTTSGSVFSIVQRRELGHEHVRTAFAISLVSGLFMGSMVWLLAGAIAGLIRMPELQPIMQMLAVLFPLNALSALSQKLLERELKYARIAAVELASYALGYAPVALLLAILGFGAWSLVYAMIGSALVRTILTFWLQPHPLRLQFSRSSYFDLMRIGSGYSVGRYASFVAQKGDYFVVSRWLGAEALGLYERAYVLMDMSNSLVTNSLNTLLFPAFAKMQDDRARLAGAFARASALMALVFLPLGLAMAILAPEIIAIVLGPGWDSAVVPFRILALAMYPRTAMKLASIVTYGAGLPYRTALGLWVYAALVVCGALLAKSFGIAGVALSTAAALCVAYVLLTHQVLRFADLSWPAFVRILNPAISLSALVVASLLILVGLLRYLDAGPLTVLLGALAAILGLAAALLGTKPRFLGPHGQWLVAQMRSGTAIGRKRI